MTGTVHAVKDTCVFVDLHEGGVPALLVMAEVSQWTIGQGTTLKLFARGARIKVRALLLAPRLLSALLVVHRPSSLHRIYPGSVD